MSSVLPYYSFAQFQGTLTGAGGTVSFGFGGGVADEGISFTFSSPQADKQMGADGTGSNSILLDRSGELTINLQQTSPQNKALLLKWQIEGTGLVNPESTLVMRNGATEVLICKGAVLMNLPDFTYASKTTNRVWKYSVIECQPLI